MLGMRLARDILFFLGRETCLLNAKAADDRAELAESELECSLHFMAPC